jgi:hypothetical protein
MLFGFLFADPGAAYPALMVRANIFLEKGDLAEAKAAAKKALAINKDSEEAREIINKTSL